MAQQFEDVLDECVIRLLEEGVTVEECLNCHSEWASELESLLRVAAKLANISSLNLSAECREANWRRVRAEFDF